MPAAGDGGGGGDIAPGEVCAVRIHAGKAWTRGGRRFGEKRGSGKGLVGSAWGWEGPEPGEVLRRE